ncbi:alpha/beta hydrolase [Bdellovibrio sp. SKB1291214]|uniref:alpha/beta fold hydrolase n=1 Tax=Bdellovibrio sp. SKB1291214 TaxID=1732569 RepID=UPI000B51AEE0|nr:alpha/beta hydrolase [Bdellovibrio sp. SKB1291214]UYL10695.1 alpha/beta hydrolase [Bdellovibrio sp. SKB1291214]
MRKVFLLSLLVLSACASQPPKTEEASQPVPSKGFDAELTKFDYPFPVSFYSFRAQNQDLKMAYMDVAPDKGSDKVIVLLHGKNFSGYYFEDMAKILVGKGYRVIMIDQIGFGKSTKPALFQYSLHGLASYAKMLLDNLKITKFQLVGHSMGGMLAARYALMYPENVTKLFMIDPLGLEDWKTLTTYKSVDQLYDQELSNNIDKVKKYQLEYYYDGKWKPEYDKYLVPAQGWFEGPDSQRLAFTSALTSEAIFTQPVYYEFKNLKMPTVLVIGTKDKTAIGKAWAPEENKMKMGNYPKMAKDVISKIKKGKLIQLEGMGHTPFIENPEKFWKALTPHL